MMAVPQGKLGFFGVVLLGFWAVQAMLAPAPVNAFISGADPHGYFAPIPHFLAPISAKKFKIYQEKAEKGDMLSQEKLGHIYEGKIKVQEENYREVKVKDLSLAVKWYVMAADQGSELSRISLFELYDNPESELHDYSKALKWLRRWAENDKAARSYYMLGRYHELGQGVPQDCAAAAKWYQKAADKGSSSAKLRLAVFYEEGKGVPQNYDRALEMYSAITREDDGYYLAQYRLAEFYYEGKGGPQNLIEAEKSITTIRSSMIGMITIGLEKVEELNDKIERALASQH